MTDRPLPFDPDYRTRTGDPETSLEAAESVKEITLKQNAVLWLLRTMGPMTDTLLNARYNETSSGAQVFPHLPRQSDSGLRARRSELVTRNLVRDTGRKKKLPSGRRAIVWEAK